MGGRAVCCLWRQSRLAALTVAGFLLSGLDVCRAEILYVSNPINNSVERFDSVTGADLGTFARAGLNLPRGLAFDRAGNLYVANSDGFSGGWIQKFTPAGVGSVFASTGVHDPEGLAFDSAGNLLVANDRNIEKFSPTGLDLGNFSSDGVPFSEGIAFDGAGDLYAAKEYRIEKFSPTGALLGSLDGGLYYYYYANGLAFDLAGSLYASTSDNTILKYNAAGVASVFISGLNLPVGLAFDGQGYLYVVNIGNNTIDKFSSTGDRVATFTGPGLNSPDFIAFQVPEPSAVGLVVLALPIFALYRWRGSKSRVEGAVEP